MKLFLENYWLIAVGVTCIAAIVIIVVMEVRYSRALEKKFGVDDWSAKERN